MIRSVLSHVSLRALAGPGLVLALSAATPASSASATVTSYPGALQAVSALSGSDAWAVGYAPGTASSGLKPLILHWNGTVWAKVANPVPAGILTGVSVLSASDAWAVGWSQNSTGFRTLTLHWDGTRWARVSSPSPEVVDGSFLQAVSAVSPSDVWAAGWYYGPGGENSNTLVLHWNGSRWKQAGSANPVPLGFNSLYGVSAPSDAGAWAVGSDDNGTLTEHWNGTRWTRVPSLDSRSTGSDSLNGVSALSPSAAWSAGGTGAGTLVLRWDGTRWSRISSPSPGTGGTLNAVSADSASDVWAAGDYFSPSQEELPLIVHCADGGCTRVASPNPGGTTGTQLDGISALSASDAWAVGYANPAGANTVAILHWNGTNWTRS